MKRFLWKDFYEKIFMKRFFRKKIYIKMKKKHVRYADNLKL